MHSGPEDLRRHLLDVLRAAPARRRRAPRTGRRSEPVMWIGISTDSRSPSAGASRARTRVLDLDVEPRRVVASRATAAPLRPCGSGAWRPRPPAAPGCRAAGELLRACFAPRRPHGSRAAGAGLPPSTGARIRSSAVGGAGMRLSCARRVRAGERLDVTQHRVRGRVAVVPGLRHRAHDDRLERGRRRGAGLAQRPRGRVDDREEQRVVVRREERALADDRLVHHDAARVDVDAAVEVALAARLLGRHVIGRAHHHAGAREVELLIAALELRHHLRHAEVEDLHDRRGADAAGQEDVLRLDVAMDDALVVRGDEAGQDLDHDVGDLVEGEAALARDAVGERGADELLHDEVRASVLERAEVVDLADVRMTDARPRRAPPAGSASRRPSSSPAKG